MVNMFGDKCKLLECESGMKWEWNGFVFYWFGGELREVLFEGEWCVDMNWFMSSMEFGLSKIEPIR